MKKLEIEQLLSKDKKDKEAKIHALLKEKKALNSNIEEYNNATLGEKLSDKIAQVAGSWGFLVIFAILLAIYFTINSLELLEKNYDPYPFVFLNLILGCIAAVQAPIIMMSQNREAKKDRIRTDNDYVVNLKSEIILEDLHMKIDEIQEEIKEINKAIADYKINRNRRKDEN